MSEFAAMQALLAIRDEGSLSGAARQLDEPKSTLSRRISILETNLNQRLTCQSGRNLTLTAAGLCYAEYAEKILNLQNDAEHALAKLKSTPAGKLRVAIGSELTRGWSTQSLNSFSLHYPEIELDIRVTEYGELAQDPAVDIWIDTNSHSSQTGFRSQKLGYWQQALYASTAFKSRTSLEDAHWIFASNGADDVVLHSTESDHTLILRPHNKLRISALHMRADAISQGHGIGILPCWIAECQRYGSNAFQRLMPDMLADDIPLWIYVQPEKQSLAVQTLINWMREQLPQKWHNTGKKDPQISN